MRRITVEDILALPDGERAELIDGVWYDMATPGMSHQAIVMALSGEFRDYIRANGGKCRVFPAPFAVFLNNDDRTYLEPDITVICDPEKLDESGCHGAPDLVVEVISPSTKKRDYGIKVFKYRSAGVKEYWIVNPDTKTVNTHIFGTTEEDVNGDQVSFAEPIPCGLYPELQIVLEDAM